MNQKLSQFIQRNGVPALIVADVHTGMTTVFGDCNTLGETNLISALFGDEAAINLLNSSLEGQLMPRMWSQGKVFVPYVNRQRRSSLG